MNELASMVFNIFKFNKQMSKEKLEVLESVNLDEDGDSNLILTEKLKFVYNHHYSPSVIKRLYKDEDPSESFLQYKRYSYLLNFIDDKFTLKNKENRCWKYLKYFKYLFMFILAIIAMPISLDLASEVALLIDDYKNIDKIFSVVGLFLILFFIIFFIAYSINEKDEKDLAKKFIEIRNKNK